jgi:hypothetical protein
MTCLLVGILTPSLRAKTQFSIWAAQPPKLCGGKTRPWELSSGLNRTPVQIVSVGPIYFYRDDVALPQGAARDDMNLAVDFGRVARRAANAGAGPAMI